MIASTQTNHPLPAHQSFTRPASPTGLELACSRLKSAGLRITQPRIAIIEALLRHDEPITIEKLHGDLTKVRCDLVTVYRCLAAFEELGLVRRCFLHNGTALFQISLDPEPAYHVVSPTSGEINTLPPALTAELTEALSLVTARLDAAGYQGVTPLVEFFATKKVPAGLRGQTALAELAR